MASVNDWIPGEPPKMNPRCCVLPYGSERSSGFETDSEHVHEDVRVVC